MHKTKINPCPLIVIIIISLFFESCQQENTNEPEIGNENNHKNIILIISDALRADVLGCYGGEAKTPNIDWLAENGVLFESAYSAGPLTMPSAVGLLTGEYPDIYRKGIIEGAGMKLPNYKIPDKKHLIQKMLKELNYDLKKSIENQTIKMFKLDRGFNDFKGYKDLSRKETRYIENITGIENKSEFYKNTYEVLQYLLSSSNNRPFFIFNWIIDPHAPYKAPNKFMNQIAVDRNKLTKQLSYYQNFVLTAKTTVGTWNEDEQNYLKDLYLKEVESVDERIGFIVEALKHKDLLKNTYILFTSDHGEEFGDHGDWGHGQNFFDELVHVPLIVMGPEIHRGKREKQLISQIDLFETLKDLLSLNFQTSSQGISFAQALSENSLENQPYDTKKRKDVYFTESTERCEFKQGLLSDKHKLLITKDNNYELYNLSVDPDEVHDISKQNPDLVKKLSNQISTIQKANNNRRIKYFQTPEEDTQSVHEITPETRNRLKGLGYLQ